jgi:hypothetical protein
MNYRGRTPASKFHFKCFRCRTITHSKDGNWHHSENQEIFLCKPCKSAQPQGKADVIVPFRT